jgi:phosphatidylglycerol:prolipoprotein diacylglycerol transferase
MGAHWLFVCTTWEHYQHRPWEVFYFWSGRAFLGGPVVTLLFVLWYTRQFRLPLWKTMDVIAPGVVIGHFFGRLGCCAAGCCHGCPTESWLGARFFTRSVAPAEWRTLPLHPTQLYEAAGLLVLFYGLLWLWRRPGADGRVAFGYFLAYPVLRFVVELYRGDACRGLVVGGLSTSQFVSLLMFVAALLALVCRLRQVRARGVDAPCLPFRAAAPALCEQRRAA